MPIRENQNNYRYWRCRVCGSTSAITSVRCSNPRCQALLETNGEIMFKKHNSGERQNWIAAAAAFLLIVLGVVLGMKYIPGYISAQSGPGSQLGTAATTPNFPQTTDPQSDIPATSEAAQMTPAQEARQRTAEIMAPTNLIATGGVHTVVIRPDGTALSAGDKDNYGACDIYGWQNLVAVSAGDYFTLGLFADGTVDAVGDNSEGQRNVSSWTDIVAIAAGDFHSVGLRSDGTVVAAGQRDYGQCNVDRLNAKVTEDVKIIAVAASFNHTVVLYSDGTVDAVGNNDNGQCNTNAWTDVVAVYAGVRYTLGLRSDGTVLVTGENSDGRCNVSHWTDVVMLAAGDFHTVGLTSDGRILHTGQSQAGQRNISGWDGAEIVAIGAGCRHTVALTKDGTILSAGENKFFQCDLDGVNIN